MWVDGNDCGPAAWPKPGALKHGSAQFTLAQHMPRRGKGPPKGPFYQRNPGGVLLSQGESTQVPSALEGLTAVFGMGTGVAPPLWPPEILFVKGTATPTITVDGRQSKDW